MNLAIFGANGRMGNALLHTLSAQSELVLSAAFVRSTCTWLNQPVNQFIPSFQADLSFTEYYQPALQSARVAIDFTLPAAFEQHLGVCLESKTPVVIGTTGLSSEQLLWLSEAAKSIPIVFAANYSVGVALMTKLCRIAASRLSDTADIEIIEAHHRFKRDAPSGTAKAIGEAIADEIGTTLETDAIYAREGDMGERDSSTIGFSTIRGGDIIGEHTALFADIGERLEITHKASNRQTFAVGALRAARWLVNKPAGLYNMEDVLELKDI